MKKNIILILTLLLLILSFSVLSAGSGDFSSFTGKVLGIKAKPKYHVENNRILILHPMVKQREVEIVHTSKLSWNGNKLSRTILSYKQLKGKKAKGERGVGKTYPFFYLPKELREFCSSARISGWKKSDSLTLDKKTFSGYSFVATVKGKRRNSAVYLDRWGDLKALTFGFPEEGISHAREMKDSATTWYFDSIQGEFMLVQVKKCTTEKKRGIPVIKIKTEKYSRFF